MAAHLGIGRARAHAVESLLRAQPVHGECDERLREGDHKQDDQQVAPCARRLRAGQRIGCPGNHLAHAIGGDSYASNPGQSTLMTVDVPNDAALALDRKSRQSRSASATSRRQPAVARSERKARISRTIALAVLAAPGGRLLGRRKSRQRGGSSRDSFATNAIVSSPAWPATPLANRGGRGLTPCRRKQGGRRSTQSCGAAYAKLRRRPELCRPVGPYCPACARSRCRQGSRDARGGRRTRAIVGVVRP